MDPFEQSAGRIVAAMGTAARNVAPAAPVMLGAILQVQPLRLQANGLTIERDSIRLNETMQAGYGLDPGDQVVVLSLDGQTYYILCKVVAA